MPANLTRTQQKQIKAVVDRAKKDNGVPQTAQQSIPFQRMFPDGICRVTDNYYTKTIQFQDINYQLAQNEDKTAIFENWCDFLNYFDSSIHLQFSFFDLTAGSEAFEQSILIPDRDDGNNEIRHEYAEMLQNQQAKGNNGLTKTVVSEIENAIIGDHYVEFFTSDPSIAFNLTKDSQGLYTIQTRHQVV